MITMKRVGLVIILISLSLIILTCSSDDNPTGPDDNEGSVYLEVFIQSPCEDGSFCTRDSLIILNGSTFSDQSLLSLKWTSSNGSSGNIAPSTNWSSDPIPVEWGDQTITVEVTNCSRMTNSDEILITRNHLFDFSPNLTISPDVIFTEEAREIQATISPLFNHNPDIQAVIFVETTSQGTVIDTIGQLFDDGLFEHGDENADDNIWSGLFEFQETIKQVRFFRAIFVINDGIKIILERSKICKLNILPLITNNDLEEMKQILENLSELISSDLQNLSNEEILDSSAAWLDKLVNVQDVVVEYPMSITFKLTNGLESGVLFVEDDEEFGLSPASSLQSYDMAYKYNNKIDELDVYSDATIFKNNQVLIWEAFRFNPSFIPSIEEIFTGDSTVINFTVNHLSGEQCSVNSLFNLGNYGTLIIRTHGAPTGDFMVGEEWDHSLTDYLTKYAMTNGKIYIKELYVNNQPTENYYYVIKHDFFDRFKGTFNQSLIYMADCFSTYQPGIRQSLHAATFYGYSNMVVTDFDYNMAYQTFSSLTRNLVTAREAFRPNQRYYHDGIFTYFEMYPRESSWHYVVDLKGGWDFEETVYLAGFERAPNGQRLLINDEITDYIHSIISQNGSEIVWTVDDQVTRIAHLDKKIITGEDGVCMILNPDIEIRSDANLFHFDGNVMDKHHFKLNGEGEASGQILSGEYAGYSFNYSLTSEAIATRSYGFLGKEKEFKDTESQLIGNVIHFIF